VPAGTPMKTATTTMPAGVGPYMITNVNPGKSWEGQINPYYAKEAIPGIPVASVNVQARVEANTATETEDVLNNTADVFDTGDSISPSLLANVKSQAANRYGTTPVVQTFYFFMNSKVKPFNSQLVREAVIMSIDRNALSRLDSGNLVPGCYFLPIGMIGHPTKPCPYGNPAQSSITVYSEERQPRTQFVTYYASVLTSLGFNVTIKSVVDTNYFPTIGNLKLNAQTGFADWLEDFPNPADFYLLLDKNSIQPVNNQNFSQVNDPKIQNAISQLDALPPSQLAAHAKDWAALDYYVAQKAYEVVYGYPVDPTFVSNRINFKAAKVQPTYGWDWTSFKLNG
jgi:peptide/nickel transport system substrate-binding protein